MRRDSDGVGSAANGGDDARWGTLTLVLLMVLGVTWLHYSSGHHHHHPHQVARRLYYLPILLSAFGWGLRGGVGVSALICLIYLPHAFLMAHGDPAPALDKAMEMGLYLVVGGLTGFLVDRQRGVADRLRRSLGALKSTQEELVHSEKMAAIGRMSAGLAHEVRTPLAAVRSTAELLGEALGPDHPRAELADLLTEETDRLNRIVSSFLDYAKPPRPELRDVDLASWLRDMKPLPARSLPESVELSVEAPESLHARVDTELFASVLHNLVRNAARAMEAGGGARVELRLTRRGSAVVLEVVDDGPGMSPELMAQALDPFVSDTPGGSGLGLAIVQRIVEAHGGSVELLPGAGGRGLRVRIEIPQGIPEDREGM